MKGWHAPKFNKKDVREKLTDQDRKDILGLLKGSLIIEDLNYIDAMNKAEGRNNKNEK